ncbi:MAG: lipopolysaccharide transport system permease protein [Paraglaciecola sp.]|jgi:lipopolysaccharide transport system permease protein
MNALASLYKHRTLIGQMVKREILGRYKGSVLGIFWSFVNPLIMLAVYTFVFSFVFNARWSTESESKAEFALALFIGLMVHSLFAECINRAPSLIINNVNYVKKVVFPLEILSVITMGSTLFHFMISLLVWVSLFLFINHNLYWTVVYLPLIILPLVLFTLGVTWFLSSLGVYLRDVGQLTGVVTTVMLFLAPVFYPLSVLPEQYHIYIYANPLTLIIEQSRAVLMFGQVPDFKALAVALLVSILVAWLGYIWFSKTRRGFADVL